MTEDLKASIIIPTYNGAGKISRVLNFLLKQPVQNIEIIVVVDGSTDNTEQVLASYVDRFSHMKIIRQKNLGRSVVRNNGAMQASGEILIFYDDDMEPFGDSVERHLDFHARHSGLLSGNVIQGVGSHKSELQCYKAWIEKTWIRKYPDGITRIAPDNLFFTAANCSIPKHLFWELKGFDTRLADAEDYDIAYRALERSIGVYFDKTNRAVHHEEITCVGYIYRLRAYSEAHHKLDLVYDSGRHKEKKERSLAKRFIYRCFAHLLWPRLIDRGFFIFLFPKLLRYRLYSVVIHALAIEYSTVRLK